MFLTMPKALLIALAVSAGFASSAVHGQAFPEGLAPVSPEGWAPVIAGPHVTLAETQEEEFRLASLLQQPPSLSQPAMPGTRAATATARPSSYSNNRLTSVPNMFGDASAGGCGGLFVGGALAAEIAHPTYGCSRLNISENNSPMPRNRVYYSYRHFADGSHIDIFSNSPQGREGDLDIDKHIFAMESTMGPDSSLEIRVPINTQLTSDINFIQTDSGSTTDGSNNNLDALLNNRTTTLGNIDMIYKRRLMNTDRFYFSGGLGLNLPTASSVRVTANIDDPNFQIYNPDLTLQENIDQGPANGMPPTGTDVEIMIDGRYRNQTVNLLPFVAFVWAPSDVWFTQGFAQVDVPLNESTGILGLRAVADGDVFFDTLDNPERARLAGQTLLRLNYGIGRWLYLNDESRINALGIVAEVHYTTTLTNADIVTLEILDPNESPLPILDRGITAGFGNLANRVDITNLVLGVPMLIGPTSVYNGFTIPVSENKGFSFEYSLSINRHF